MAEGTQPQLPAEPTRALPYERPTRLLRGVSASGRAQMDITYDAFIRTTDAKHEATVKALLDAVWDAGDIYKASYSGRYCVGCEEYKDDEDLDEDHNCLIHKQPCPLREEVRRRVTPAGAV